MAVRFPTATCQHLLTSCKNQPGQGAATIRDLGTLQAARVGSPGGSPSLHDIKGRILSSDVTWEIPNLSLKRFVSMGYLQIFGSNIIFTAWISNGHFRCIHVYIPHTHILYVHWESFGTQASPASACALLGRGKQVVRHLRIDLVLGGMQWVRLTC